AKAAKHPDAVAALKKVGDEAVQPALDKLKAHQDQVAADPKNAANAANANDDKLVRAGEDLKHAAAMLADEQKKREEAAKLADELRALAQEADKAAADARAAANPQTAPNKPNAQGQPNAAGQQQPNAQGQPNAAGQQQPKAQGQPNAAGQQQPNAQGQPNAAG